MAKGNDRQQEQQQQAQNARISHETLKKQQEESEKWAAGHRKEIGGTAKAAIGMMAAPLTFGSSLKLTKDGFDDIKAGHQKSKAAYDTGYVDGEGNGDNNGSNDSDSSKDKEHEDAEEPNEQVKHKAEHYINRGAAKQQSNRPVAGGVVTPYSTGQGKEPGQDQESSSLYDNVVSHVPDDMKPQFNSGYATGKTMDYAQGKAAAEQNLTPEQKQGFEQGSAMMQRVKQAANQGPEAYQQALAEEDQEIQQMSPEEKKGMIQGVGFELGEYDRQHQKQDSYGKDGKDQGVSINVNGQPIHLDPGTSVTIGNNGQVSFNSAQVDGNSIQASQHPMDPAIERTGINQKYQNFDHTISAYGHGEANNNPTNANTINDPNKSTATQQYGVASKIRDQYAQKGAGFQNTTGNIANGQQQWLTKEINAQQPGKTASVQQNNPNKDSDLTL